MTLRELLNTCQNTYQTTGFYKNNPLFTCTLQFENKSDVLTELDYVLKADYTNDQNYLLKYRNRKVIYWWSYGRNDLYVEIEGHY